MARRAAANADDDLLGPGDGDNKPKATNAGGVAGKQLRSFVERIERLEEEKAGLGEDIRQVKLEAKAAGFDTKVITAIIRERKKEPAEVQEFESILDLYRHALGMVVDTDGE